MTTLEMIETHGNTVEEACRIINRIFGGHRYFSSIDWHEEDRHDGKVTIVLSLTEIKGGDE